MSEPPEFIYTPDPTRLVCGECQREMEPDAEGWWLGPRDPWSEVLLCPKCRPRGRDPFTFKPL